MRAYVFTDTTLSRRAGQFVWLEIDTEKARNAALRKKLGIPAIPTFFIVDPATERVALRWVGGFGVAQLDRLLDDGLLAVNGAGVGASLDSIVVAADAYYGQGRYDLAAPKYRDALALAPVEWPRYPRVAEALLTSLSQIEKYEDAVRFADQAFPRVRHTPSAAVVAGTGLDDAVALPKETPNRASWITEFEQATRDVVNDFQLPLSGDDRSGLYISLLESRRDAGDDAGRLEVAGQWSQYLNTMAAMAPSADARMVYDSHRLSAFLELGQPEHAIPMLEQSEKDVPDDYNPPARLAIAYRAMKKWDDGLAASNRAMARAYGPRKLGFFTVRTDLYLGKADTTAAVRTLKWAIAYVDSLPQEQRSAASIAAFHKRLDTLRPALHP
jgi:tetratricopeptide (TPR) repeat protein